MAGIDKFFFTRGGNMPATKKRYDCFSVMLESKFIKEVLAFAILTKTTRGQLMRKWIIEGYVRDLLLSKKIKNKA